MYDLGVARSINYKVMTQELVDACAAAGIYKIEVSFCNPLIDFDEEEIKQKVEESILFCQKAGVKIVSLHLPYGRTWEPCVLDDEVRERAMEQYLRLIKILYPIQPERYILHPGYPNVPDEERAQRIQNFRKNVMIIADAVKPAKVAVEDMPRDCLGNTAEELIALVDGLENICVCCDTNHFYQELTHDAVRKLGKRIETLHINDYDGKVETHWLAGEGVVEWSKVLAELENAGYNGPFLYECGQMYTCDQVVESKRKIFEAYNQSKES